MYGKQEEEKGLGDSMSAFILHFHGSPLTIATNLKLHLNPVGWLHGMMVVTDRDLHFWRSPRLLGWACGVNAKERNFVITVGIDLCYKAGERDLFLKYI